MRHSRISYRSGDISLNAYRLNAASLRICHCEAVGRGNLQHRSVMTYAPINIENLGFTMLIG